MFYANWMQYIKDEAKITEIAMPGAHNSGTKGMNKIGRCQNGTILEQYEYGVREFSLRTKEKRGKIYISHSVFTGYLLEDLLKDFATILEKYDDFFVIDISPYPNQPIGPLTFHYDSNPQTMDELFEKYLNPKKYALTDYDNIKNVTLGNIRKQGKRYLIHNEKEEYKYSKNAPLLGPWDPEIYGYKPEKFAKEVVNYLKELDSEGFFQLQTQLTPNFGTENGFNFPIKLDELLRPYFPKMIREIVNDEEMLKKVNIISSDFMTKDYFKQKEILNLNLQKNIVKEDMKKEYITAIEKSI